MKTKKLIALAIGLVTTTFLSAQVTLGSIKGKVLNDESGKPLPMAKVWVETGSGMVGTKTDFDGFYKIDALKPGVYNLYCKALGKDTMAVTEVKVSPDQITTLDNIRATDAMLGIVLIEYNDPIIKEEINRIDIRTEDIENSPLIRNPKELFASMNSDIIIPEGTSDVIIRGSRPGDVIYYIDGVKTSDLNGVPGVAIGSMMGYTGGIPAKYGDTTGGVMALETKGYFDLYYAWKANQQ